MNAKNAIKNVANVPNKFDKSGGDLSGAIQMNGHYIRLTKNNNNYARLGYEESTNDVFISNYENNWFRLKPDKTITYGGHKVYTAFDKPTPSEIGALDSNGTAIAANKLSTARTIALTGSVTGSVSFDGSKNVSLVTTTNHTHDYLPLSGGTLTGETTFNNYLSINAWSNYGTGKAKLWFDGNSKNLIVENASTLRLGNNVVYHTANKPTPADIGAIPNSKMTVSKTAPSKPSTGDLWISW